MVRQLVEQYLPQQSFTLYLIGSQAGRSELKRSDVDVLIDAGNPLPPEVMGRLQAGLEELPTLYLIDLVDFYQTSEDFRKVALESAEVI